TRGHDSNLASAPSLGPYAAHIRGATLPPSTALAGAGATRWNIVRSTSGSNLLRFEQDGDFAFGLDGDGQVGGVVVVEIACGCREDALVLLHQSRMTEGRC